MGTGLRTSRVSRNENWGFRGGRRRVRGVPGWPGPYSRSSWTRAVEVSPASDPASREGRAAPQRLRESQPVLREPKGAIGALRKAGPLFPRDQAAGSPAQKRGSPHRHWSHRIPTLGLSEL